MTILRWSTSARATLCVVAALVSVSIGCGDDEPGMPDAGSMPDATVADSGPEVDAWVEDVDAGEVDDAGEDASTPGDDAGPELPDAGEPDGGDTTPIPAPQPIEPSSTARTASPMIRFRWALAAPATGARLDICRDPACAMVIETQDVVGDTVTTLVPPDPRPSSRVFYWRLTGRDGTRLGTEQSPIWSFSVHGLATTTSATWGSTYDLDGDGFADILGGAPESSVVRLWRGGDPLGGAPPTPDTEISAAAPLRLGTAIANGGDLNGDGLGDFVIGGANAVYAFHGVAGGLPASLGVAGASTTLSGLGTLDALRVAVAGDVDRDGYADLVIGDPTMLRIVLHRGSATGLELTGTPIARTELGFGRSVAGGCDVNGDGYSDVIVGADDAALVLLGGPTGLGATATALTPPPSSAGFGASVACAGDVNGDGHPDVIVGAPEDSAAFVYHGNVTGIGTIASGALRKPPGAVAGATTRQGDDFGSMVAAAGDLNGDEYGDVIVVAPGVVAPADDDGFYGYAFTFHGSAAGLPVTVPTQSTAHARALGSGVHTNRTTAARTAGDANGDGIDDVVSGRGGGGTGAVLLNLGVQSTGIPLAQTWLIEGGTVTGMGTTVAWLWSRSQPRWLRGT